MASPLQTLLSSSPSTLSILPEDILATRLLGTRPPFLRLAQSSPTCTNFFSAAMRSCMLLPTSDLGFHPLTPQHRRLTLLHSAQSRQCAYCTRHAAACGDILRGSSMRQYERGLPQSDLKAEPEFLRVLNEACHLAHVSDSARAQFEAAFPACWDSLVGMISFCAWLNFVMVALDVPIEGRLVPFADRVLGDAPQYVLQHRVEGQVWEARRGAWTGVVRNWAEMLLIPPAVALAGLKEAWIGKVDKQWVARECGTVPGFVEIAGGVQAVCCLGVREVVRVRGAWRLMKHFAQVVQCEELERDAELLESKQPDSMRVLDDDKFAVMVEYVRECAEKGLVKTEVQEKVVSELRKEEVLDVAGCVAIFSFWMRVLIMNRHKLK